MKKRLSPEESRSAALEAARLILIEMGPQAVTLKAVASRIDRTHANLLHHFGSAAGLQKALAAYLADTVCETIGQKMAESPPGERNMREIVDLAFDAFDSGGAGALATWMSATGNEGALDPVIDAIHRLIDGMAPDAHEKRLMHEDTLALVLMAMGDAQLGGPMAEALALPRDTARALACELITGRIAAFWAEQGGKPAS
ncbi:AcrR family transcriptional regulator [Sphingopyxis panaciterrae]|nr:AcrR family transcriptional regulator [Sphingopyxis panaciterrae]